MADGAGAKARLDAGQPLRRAGMAVVVFAAALGLYLVYLARTDFHLFPPEDTVEVIVAAREVAAGEGLTTRTISPPVLVFLDQQGRTSPPWPSVTRSPLPVLVMGGLMRLFDTPLAVALSSGVFFLLSVPLIYLIGDRLVGRVAGLLGSLAYAVSPCGLWYGVTGMTESSTIFSLAAIVYLLMGTPTAGGCLLAGVAAGLGFLGRTTFKLWAPVIVLYILWRTWRSGPARAVAMSLIFLLPLAASVLWFDWTMGRLTGQWGYFAQEDIAIRRDTGLYPGRSSSLSLESWSPRAFVMQHKAIMVRKYARIAEQAWPALVKMGALPFLVSFFLVELFLVLGRGKRVVVHWLVYGLLLVQLLLTPLASFGHGGVGENRYLDPFGPLAAVLGAAFFVELLGRYQVPLRRAAFPLVLLVALTAIPTVFDLAVGAYHQDDIRYWTEVGEYLAEHVAPGQIIAATHPDLISWRAHRYTVGLPVTPDQFARLDAMLPVQWVFLRHRAGENRERTSAWEPIMNGVDQLPGFILDNVFPDGAVLLRREPGT